MDNVAPLAQAWLDAKRAESAANAQRLQIEKELCGALDVPDEGSKTIKIDGFKITVTQPITRKIDLDAWEKVKAHCPENLLPVKTKIEADGTGCKYLAEKEPKIWAKIAKAFTSTPAKTAIKVEAL